MKIAVNIAPLKGDHAEQHKVRGSGFYLTNLQKALLEYDKENTYTFFTKEKEIQSDCDIVHYPYFEPFFLTIPLQRKYKTIVTVHDLTPIVFPKHFPAGVKGTVKWFIQKQSLRHVEAIITDSSASKHDIHRLTGVDNNRIHVVYLAAGNEQVEKEIIPDVRKKYNLPKTFGLYVGDATWNKNLSRVVAAFTKLNIPLVMVGKALSQEHIDLENPWNKDLARVQAHVRNNALFKILGFVPKEDLLGLYKAASVFVMPSLYEGFGLPILEALQAGCPVVTSKEGSLPEVAGDAAYYVDAYSDIDITAGIKTVLNDPKLQASLIEKGKEQAKKFTWRQTALQTVAVYTTVYEKAR